MGVQFQKILSFSLDRFEGARSMKKIDPGIGNAFYRFRNATP
jgi:hypothetical protein